MNPELYALFWYISLPSLFVPTSQYVEEVKRLNDEITAVKTKDPKNKKELDRLTKLLKVMQAE